MTQQTFVIVKPDAVRGGHIGEILGRYEAAGLEITKLRMLMMDEDLAAKHYAEHVGEDYYPPLVAFMTSGPVVAVVLEGDKAIEQARIINGATDCTKAAAGTIRRDFGTSVRENAVHGSDSEASAAREVALWFPEG